MELHDTAMGRRLIEHTLPELVRQANPKWPGNRPGSSFHLTVG